jgi:uncharacterized membrane protein YfcA
MCRYAAQMTYDLSLAPLDLLLWIAVTAVIAGMIKGIVGFAMPMIFITGMTIFVGPDLALGLLILPTLVTNAWQAGRQGFSAALKSLYDHRWFLGLGYGVLLASTQLVPLLSQDLFFLCLGVFVVGFASLMLSGWSPQGRSGLGLSCAYAVIGGLSGAISGVWGPPTVMYLSSYNLDKQAQMRAQGVIYGLGAVLLLFGHLGSGIGPGRFCDCSGLFGHMDRVSNPRSHQPKYVPHRDAERFDCGRPEFDPPRGDVILDPAAP